VVVQQGQPGAAGEQVSDRVNHPIGLSIGGA